MKGSDIKKHIFYDSIYIIFYAILNYGDKKQINGCLGLGGMEKINCKEVR